MSDDPLQALANALRTENPSGTLRGAAGTSARDVPEYIGLRIAGWILLVTAGIQYCVAAAALIVLVILLCGYGNGRAILPLCVLSGLCITAPINHAIASGCFALRDIALNSWRSR